MSIVLDGSNLNLEKVVRIARQGEKVELHPDALSRIVACRAMLEEKLKNREIM
jgi:histidine ammonia-lyase